MSTIQGYYNREPVSVSYVKLYIFYLFKWATFEGIITNTLKRSNSGSSFIKNTTKLYSIQNQTIHLSYNLKTFSNLRSIEPAPVQSLSLKLSKNYCICLNNGVIRTYNVSVRKYEPKKSDCRLPKKIETYTQIFSLVYLIPRLILAYII